MRTSVIARIPWARLGVYLAGVCLAVGCAGSKIEPAPGLTVYPTKPGDVAITAGVPFLVASEQTSPTTIRATVQFTLTEVPKPATLEMLVMGIASACPLESQPQAATTLAVNGREVNSFTLGPSRMGKQYRVTAKLDPATLRVGANTLEVRGSPCTLGRFEVIRVNAVVVGAGR